MKKVVCAALAAASLVVAAAATAAVVLPAKNAALGGGSIGAAFVRTAGGHPDVVRTILLVDEKDVRSVRVIAAWPTPCGGRTPVTAIFEQVVKVQPDGTFAGKGVVPETERTPGGVTFSISGALRSPTSAWVGGKAAFSFVENGATAACAGTVKRQEVRAAPAVAGKPAPKGGAAYFGATSDKGSVAVRVAAGGQRIAEAAEEGWLDCQTDELKQDGGPFHSNVTPPIAIRADGTFHGEERFDSQYEWLPGTVGHMRSVLDGRFGATTVGGTGR